MLNRVLQTLFLCLATVILATGILTTGIAFSSPLPNGVISADQAIEQDAEIVQPAPSTSSPQEASSPTQDNAKGDRNTHTGSQPAQANPSVPYDPYDYNALREMDREIYGEVREP